MQRTPSAPLMRKPFGGRKATAWAIVVVALTLSPGAVSAQWKDQDDCSASGRYLNGWYGFSVEIPAGLHGCPNSPVFMSDHGTIIPLTDPPAGRYIECFAGYNSLFHESAKDAADAALEWLREPNGPAKPGSVVVLRQEQAILGSLRAFHLVIRYQPKDGGASTIEDTTVALRVINQNYPVPSHEYSVTLTTPEKYYDLDNSTLTSLVKSWRPEPSYDNPASPPPNPRLQRTPSAPLSRQPLGDH